MVDTDTEDLCLATMGVPGDYVLFTVDGVDVTAAHFMYWLSYDISYLDYYYSYYGMDMDLGSDQDLVDYLMENSRNAAVETVLTKARAEELGYSLSEEDLTAIDDSIASVKESYGGDEGFNEALRQLGMDQDLYYLLTASPYYYNLLEDELFAGHPTREEAEEYAEEGDYLYAKHILIMTCDADYMPLDDETLAERTALAEDILAQLQASDNLEEEFDTLMNQYSEDTGLESNPDGYLFTAGQMVSEFEDATRELDFGEISGLVEHVGEEGSSYSGYHIILRLDPADSEDLISDWLYDAMDDLINSWWDEAEYEYSDEYNNLDLQMFYAKYTAYQEAFNATTDED